MSGSALGVVELLLVLGIVVAFAARELWSLRRRDADGGGDASKAVTPITGIDDESRAGPASEAGARPE